jgi:hypothetical protein
VQLTTVPICEKCNKYWFIKELLLLSEIRINGLKILYSNLCSNNNEFIEKRNNHRKIYNISETINIYYRDSKLYKNQLLYNIYKKNNKFETSMSLIEDYKKEIKKYKMMKIKKITKKTYLSSLYDCKALIESKRHLIPHTFENNRRLVKILQITCKYYSNLEHSYIRKYNHEQYHWDGFVLYIYLEQEMYYLCLEYILVSLERGASSSQDNFSKIENTNEIQNHYTKLYKIYSTRGLQLGITPFERLLTLIT